MITRTQDENAQLLHALFEEAKEWNASGLLHLNDKALVRPDDQVAEVPVGPVADKQSNRPVRIGAVLQVAHNQYRLRGGADVKPGGRARYFDAQLRPFARAKVRVGLVLTGCLAAKAA